ncbi:uncharacterized protein J7T54_008114 [Emericellopsis cladophorae]|uniref:Benzoylformate decarboxylase n=1 Tax=Emericellopsis cladophorae TaxID=2686198 RepID=A0A9P9Y833_9HYPO|nr:uncharacterized protein J7T54_008114 [Emericellopsis cladophorae]KAI6785020.1 hypothetical protein J7T54_008114 [Emericellopsis cladophorae]
MPPTTIRSPPSVADYTPLEEFQSQTPASFTGGKPVLYHHLTGAKATIPKSQAGVLAMFPVDAPSRPPHESNGEEAPEEIIEREVDVFVHSESFTIFSKEAEAGVSIPYPSISIHAVKNEGGLAAIWMQLEFSDGGDSDEDYNCIDLSIIPRDATPEATKALYEAMSACSDLHPDPNEGEDEEEDYSDRIVFEGSHEALEGFEGVLRGQSDGGLPPPMPGSGGWITADNVNEYFDADGNWIKDGDHQADLEEDEELGDGAGRTRGHDEVAKDGVNGEQHEGAKRAKTD